MATKLVRRRRAAQAEEELRPRQPGDALPANPGDAYEEVAGRRRAPRPASPPALSPSPGTDAVLGAASSAEEATFS